ncbi:hypothetical protein FB451DRAFT_1411835 [Mycena latifolia]|nr:hypothetical protein FB451DRAFT_1411835 [Mycena latifolia]
MSLSSPAPSMISADEEILSFVRTSALIENPKPQFFVSATAGRMHLRALDPSSSRRITAQRRKLIRWNVCFEDQARGRTQLGSLLSCGRDGGSKIPHIKYQSISAKPELNMAMVKIANVSAFRLPVPAADPNQNLGPKLDGDAADKFTSPSFHANTFHTSPLVLACPLGLERSAPPVVLAGCTMVHLTRCRSVSRRRQLDSLLPRVLPICARRRRHVGHDANSKSETRGPNERFAVSGPPALPGPTTARHRCLLTLGSAHAQCRAIVPLLVLALSWCYGAQLAPRTPCSPSGSADIQDCIALNR